MELDGLKKKETQEIRGLGCKNLEDHIQNWTKALIVSDDLPEH